jgi:biotin-(acetyl-CoA carboxylase) ligase
MPLDTVRSGKKATADMSLPPPFTLVRLRELGDAFAHAISLAPEQGAGTLVYVGRFDLAEFALVLEPDEPLRQARRAFYAGMVALADALAALAQPETAIGIDWPDAISVNYGLVGGGRLAWPQGANEDETPAWLVFGGAIRTVSMTGAEPGLNPLVTTLEEEGFTELTSNQVVESFARHFMVALDSWEESGFGTVAKNYLERLPREKDLSYSIDENGDLLMRHVGQADIERQAFLPRLATPGWLDPAAKGPRPRL